MKKLLFFLMLSYGTLVPSLSHNTQYTMSNCCEGNKNLPQFLRKSVCGRSAGACDKHRQKYVDDRLDVVYKNNVLAGIFSYLGMRYFLTDAQNSSSNFETGVRASGTVFSFFKIPSLVNKTCERIYPVPPPPNYFSPDQKKAINAIIHGEQLPDADTEPNQKLIQQCREDFLKKQEEIRNIGRFDGFIGTFCLDFIGSSLLDATLSLAINWWSQK